MKKLLILMAVIAASTFTIAAQKGLNVAKVFDGRYAKLPDAAVTYLIGEPVEKYDLTVYRSLSVTCDNATAKEIEQLVLKDGLTATSKETVYRGGQLRYGSFTLPKRSYLNRYLFYVNKEADTEKSNARIVVVYMSGDASAEKVKKLINSGK
ncbi:MAG: DUF6108 family protein [Muribaculaceae bacterium]